MLKRYGKYFNESFTTKLLRDSDDFFTDQLIADLYLKIVGLDCINTLEERKKILRAIYSKGFRNSEPILGFSNVIKRNGESHRQYQAQEIWVGVQYSLVASLFTTGMKSEAISLLCGLYDTFYNRLRIPFAIPEGIIANGFVSTEDFMAILGCEFKKAHEIMCSLQNTGSLMENFRISGPLKEDAREMLVRDYNLATESIEELIKFFQSKAITYTVGQYLRAGMIYSLNYIE